MCADAATAASVLDRSVLRYVLLHASRLNMLALERRMQALRGPDGLLRLERGAVRSNNAHRIAATLQLAAEIQLADPDVLEWIAQDQDGLRRQMATDAAYFPSDEWADDGPTTFLDAVPAADVLPRDRFFAYMLERTRLHEDKATTIAGAPAGATAREGADREAAFRYLRSVAAGVFAMLHPSYRLAEWRHAVRTRDANAMRKPAPEVFDALLLGPRSLVDESAAWRYSARSKRRDLESARFGSSISSAPILLANEMLSTALGRPDPDGASLGDLFAFLADEVRLLPTSPASDAVARAVTSFHQRHTESHGQADPRQLDDALLLMEFNELLTRNERLLVHALACAAFLAELPGAANSKSVSPGERTMGALRLLAAGLDFDDKSGEEILSALSRFEARLLRQPDTPASAAAHLGVLPTDGFAQITDRAKQARGLARDWNAGLVALAAWKQSEERLGHFADTGAVADASAHELVHALLQGGFVQSLMTDPRRMSLQDWSEALVTALTSLRVPAWLGALALRRLGADFLPPSQREALLQSLFTTRTRLGAGAVPADEERAIRVMLGDGRPGADHRRGTVIVLRHPETHAFDRWREPPRDAMVLILTVEQATELTVRLRPFLKALPRPVRVDCEAPATDRRLGSLELLITQATGTIGAVDLLRRRLRGLLFLRPRREFDGDQVASVNDLLAR